MKKNPHINKPYNGNRFSFGSNLWVKLLFGIIFFQMTNRGFAQTFKITADELASIKTNFFDAAEGGFGRPDTPYGKLCRAFAVYNTQAKPLNRAHLGDFLLYDLTEEDFNSADLYFAHPVLLRLLLDSRYNDKVGESVRRTMTTHFLNLLVTKDYSTADVWEVDGSENHNAIRRSTDYLGSLFLQRRGFGTSVLKDGRSVNAHVTSGSQFWNDYFESRAKKGLEFETHAPSYTKYTLQCYYNIHDLANNTTTRKIAQLYLDLYWAEMAQKFLPASLAVGGDATRVYKKTIFVTQQAGVPKCHMTFFRWADTPISGHAGHLVESVTTYTVPTIISKIALNKTSNGFKINNKSWGKVGDGLNTVSDPCKILFHPDNGSGYVQKQSYVTKDYVMGTGMYNINYDFSNIVAQNRAMGVFFNTPGHRILIHGNSTVTNGEQKGYNDLTGITGTNCLVAWRPSNYSAANALGTRVFVNNPLVGARTLDSGWWFFESGSSYVAMRPANGSGTWAALSAADGNGSNLELSNADSPVIIECALQSSYASFAAFKTDVKNNALSFSRNVLTYTSSAGEVFTVNATTTNSNPTLMSGTTNMVYFAANKTFDSPFVNGMTATDSRVYVKNGTEQLVLDFGNNTSSGQTAR